ncbi:hypothetical protein [Virgibacillus pantothenticus]|uniref:Uncharacterized protein n=1 Tax=Virgibacillus pantothenticus TaxID=1473 RepID=A0A0L0QJP4_VIRPA|nr:hypothetical protein [Virgibacillus pantothenticus]KNE18739.1 hypothetical protein AFK71_08990 [Virgibacillus pantothenticus]MED3736841.1 hypothetical protein [Virgibacillus pantothenticus]QTY15152.1 hypothetical protein KBP50_14715 [Virgibacillus pantothenticus]SIT04806.1 hypothetical protein SAMN05421787_11226 [Virgibacillus pantothenticus]
MIIETVKHKLVTDWTLIAHPDYQLYSNENNNYVVVDPDHSIVLNFAVDNTEVDIKHVTWEVAFKVKNDTRTITITSEPEVFEED